MSADDANRAAKAPDPKVADPKAIDTKHSAAIERGLAYLAKHQAEDGGWHSEAYGALRGGAAVTALALYSLSHVPAPLCPRSFDAPARVRRALKFLLAGVDDEGRPGNNDKSLDYPTYAAALMLTAVRRLELKLPKDDGKQRMELIARYLIDMQISEARGFAPDSPHHGGWELTGDRRMRGVTTGTNVSITAYALEAISTLKSDEAATARRRAIAWLARCQNLPGGGGFFFQPDRHNDNNKAQWTDEGHTQPRSYGGPTADGVRALTDAGVKPDDPKVQAAVAWLAKHDSLNVVPGFEQVAQGLQWPKALRFYYFASLAKVLPLLATKDQTSRKAKLIDTLVAEQRQDGRWENEAHHMREDDPLIATSLALVGLGTLA